MSNRNGFDNIFRKWELYQRERACSSYPNMISFESSMCQAWGSSFSPERLRILVYRLRHQFPPELTFNSEFHISHSCPLLRGGIRPAAVLTQGGTTPNVISEDGSPLSCAVPGPVQRSLAQGSPQENLSLPRLHSLKPTPNNSCMISCILPSLANFLEKDYSCSVSGVTVQERVIISIILKP